MAEQLTEWPQWRATRRSKYPWDEWFNGNVWLLEQGRDFDATPERMRQMIGMTARKRGIKVRTSVNKPENKVALQMVSHM